MDKDSCKNKKKALSVAGSGDHAFNLITNDVKEFDMFDIIMLSNTLDYIDDWSLVELNNFIASLDGICNPDTIEYIHYIFLPLSMRLDKYGYSSNQIFCDCPLSLSTAVGELNSEVVSKNGVKVLKRVVGKK